MNSLRGIARKIDAILLMVIAGLILGLAISYNYYQSRKTTVLENENLAASLLAYGLPSEAAQIIEENIRRQPLSDRSMKLRKVLADIYMNDLNDYEKALAELVYLKTTAPASDIASGSEESIRYCLTRLGRVYDAERSRLLSGGINPIENTVSSQTVVRLGDRHAIGVEELRAQLQALNLPADQMTRETIDGVVGRMTQELLLSRAAERENVKKDPEFIRRVRAFENSLAISSYLHKLVPGNGNVDDEKKRQLLADEINRLAKKEAMQIDGAVIAREFLKTASATADPVAGD